MRPAFTLKAACAALLVTAGCSLGEPFGSPIFSPRPPPPRPEGCRELAAGAGWAAEIAQAADGTVFCLQPGTYPGPLAMPMGVTLWGPKDAVIKSNGVGTTVLLSSRSRLLGLTVDGSGGRFDVLDAAIKLDKGEDAVIEGVTVDHAMFGILLEQAKRVTVRGNHVIGIGGDAMGLRGDGIRLWETYDSLVEGNLVEQTRDLVVWYSSRNVLKDNHVVHGRYGTHFMYSHGNTVEDCSYLFNEVGIFVMYSRDTTLRGNVMLGASGAAGMGVGMKESGNIKVERNVLVDNTLGFFLDNSPLTHGETNQFVGNVIRLGDVGVSFLSTTHDNTFRDNEFRDNQIPVRVESGGDAMGLVWEGNAFDDYVGYDLDEDGFGDIPYEHSNLSNVLEARNADLAFLHGTPAMALVSVAAHVVPLFAPKPVLRDEKPRMRGVGVLDAH